MSAENPYKTWQQDFSTTLWRVVLNPAVKFPDTLSCSEFWVIPSFNVSKQSLSSVNLSVAFVMFRSAEIRSWVFSVILVNGSSLSSLYVMLVMETEHRLLEVMMNPFKLSSVFLLGLILLTVISCSGSLNKCLKS